MRLIIMTECFVTSFDGDFSKKKKKKPEAMTLQL